MNMHAQVFPWTFDFVSLGRTTRSRIARLCEKFMMTFLRNCQTASQSTTYIPTSDGWVIPIHHQRGCFFEKETQVDDENLPAQGHVAGK